MKHILQRLLPLALVLALLLAAAPGAAAAEGTVTDLTLNRRTLSLTAGGSGTLTATITVAPPDAEAGAVEWSADHNEAGEEIVSIRELEPSGDADADGDAEDAGETEPGETEPGKRTVTAVITGVRPGETTVTAKCGGRTAVCTVTVDPVIATGVTLSRTEVSLYAGETATLTGLVVPSNSTDQTLTWAVTAGKDNAYLRTTESQSGQSVTIVGHRSGTATVTASTKEGIAASCTVTVNAARLSASLSNGQLEFSSLISDLESRCQNIAGSPLSYLTNISVSTSEGTLYEGYVSESDHGEGVSGAMKYYNSYSGERQLRKIIFIPRTGFTGTATITFTGYAASNEAFTGSILVNIGGTPLSYTSEDGEPVCFRAADFTNYSQTQGHSTIKYVRFNLPSSNAGTLYYNYIDSDINEGTVSSATQYYRTGSPSLDKVWFVPNANYSGNITISFTACDTAGSTFYGSLLVHVVNAAGGSAGSSLLSYNVRPGDTVWLNASDFNTLSYERTSYPLNYVFFSALPIYNRGTLYCSGYGAVSVNQYFYRSGSNRRLLSDVYFTAYNIYSGTVSIPFTAYATNGLSFRGTVTITISNSTTTTNPSGTTSQNTIYDTGNMIVYSSSGEAVSFNSQDFYTEAQRYLSNTLSTVSFYTPDASQGRLCLNYSSPVNYSVINTTAESTEYPATTVSLVSFLPRAGFSGAAYIRYVAADQSGKSYTGTLAVNVDPPSVSSYFDDMGGYAWAVPSAEFLARYNIVTGTDYRTYSPAGMTKRGDFILMLQRCFDFPSVGDVSFFGDVSVWSYYGPAITGAYYAGLTNGDGTGNFRPEAPLTRQEAAVLLYRCMRRNGSLPNVTMADIAGFADQAQIAPYAMTAVATLARLGVLTGSGGYLNPTQNLTRAEMASMFHRALT